MFTVEIPEKQHRPVLPTSVSSALRLTQVGVGASSSLWSIKGRATKAAQFLKESVSTKNDEKPPKLQVWVTIIAKLQNSNFIRHTPTLLSGFQRLSRADKAKKL